MARTRPTFTREFNGQAVKLVTERGYSFAEAARQLGVRDHQVRTWTRQLEAVAGDAFPGAGRRSPGDAELHRLRAENERLLMERDILKRSGGVLRQGVHLRYESVSRQVSSFPARVMCRVLRGSAAGHSDWVRRPPSVSERRRAERAVATRQAHADVKGRCGSRRTHAELVARGHRGSPNTVAKVMQAEGIRAISHRRFRVRTTDSDRELPVAANVLDQRVPATGPDPVWLTDITCIPTREGWVYLAAVEDLYPRRVVGWSMGTSLESRLGVDALHMAVARRFPDEGLLAHSGRGSQYASEHPQRVRAGEGIVCSVSRVGNCWDNAPRESFVASLKKEPVHHQDYPPVEAAKASLFEYIEVFYNRIRRHSSLGYVAPAEFESADHP